MITRYCCLLTFNLKEQCSSTCPQFVRMKPLLVAIGFILALRGCKTDNKVAFPEGLQAYSVADSLPFNPEWLEADKKLVVASKGLYLFSIPFMDIVEEYDIPVIIVIFVKDNEKVIKAFEEYNFPYPFLHDPEQLLLKNNDLMKKLGFTNEKNTVFSFFMEGDEIYEPAEIGMRDLLREQLEKFTAGE